ncbi:sulfurtransferase TusA family protein [Deferrisoma palaeochoriense]
MSFLDITGDVCPMTLVRVRMALEQVEPGQELEILMAPGEPVASIPRTLRDEGHEVVSVERDGGAFRVRVRKKA